MSLPLKMWPLIEAARQSPAMTADAATLLAEDAPRWFGPKTREGVRASDAGRCARELWADIHHLLDLPQEPEAQVNRLDIGTVMGAWYACLFSVGLSNLTSYTCTREENVSYAGVPGHADLIVYHGDSPLWVIDIKSNYSARTIGPAKDHQRLQVAQYALSKGASVFSVFTVAPATTSPMYRQDDFNTQDYAQLVDFEIARLRVAEADEMPPANPPEAWRCRFCRFSACNRNPYYSTAWTEAAS